MQSIQVTSRLRTKRGFEQGAPLSDGQQWMGSRGGLVLTVFEPRDTHAVSRYGTLHLSAFSC